MAGSKIISVDLGGTNLRVSLVQKNKVLKFIKNPTPSDGKKLVSKMMEMIAAFDSRDVKGIGVSSPGPLKEGIIMNPPNLPLKNFNLKKALQTRFRKKVVVEHDSKCVALAELKLGVKKNNFIVLTLGTGIGGGIIIDGKLYKGEGYAGELGHIILDNETDFETLAASKAQRKLTSEAFGKELLVSELIKIKDPKAEKIIERIARYLGQGIGSLINVFDPEIVVISGGVKEAGEPFLNRVRKYARQYSVLPKETRIQWTKIEHPNVLGASLLIE